MERVNSMSKYKSYRPDSIEQFKKIFAVIENVETFDRDFIHEKTKLNMNLLSNVIERIKIAGAIKGSAINGTFTQWRKTDTYDSFIVHINALHLEIVRMENEDIEEIGAIEFHGMKTPQNIKDLQKTMWQMRRNIDLNSLASQ